MRAIFWGGFPPLLLVAAAVTSAQTPTPLPFRGAQMQAIATALGVDCNYCHVAVPNTQAGFDYVSDANPKKRIARMMIAMTADINAAIPAAMLRPASETLTVSCATCHRGVADPRPLPDILIRTFETDGEAALIAKFRDLRSRYYGRDVYDFSDTAITRVASRLTDRSLTAAVAFLQANLEFNPRSADSYVLMAMIQIRRLDDAGALGYIQKALEIDPKHPLAQGYDLQLKQYQRLKPQR